ncbi:uroporphyrinogen-III synthase [Phyllobacterium zundukense]|jgi:uroporphyrinogen-III synthase|uniref:Uroporphyrinogen-III synthase n=1 Tax=Phyllobacterium zundukense TaxID=1867719 RepID=A0ACD4D8A4_9HYPH|nr:uroporphyrinogen-III synthase [Phyllobacterium zundukense]UXN61984.1 uroporphyrinogen-III synthase [Phyllobacterium zundukense]
MKTVLVTRPQPGAIKTAERLLGDGFLPLVLPLTKIVPLPVKTPRGKFDAVAVTSANALRQAPDKMLRPFLGLPCFVVGEATAAAARARGFETVTTGDRDGVSLAQTIGEELCAGARVLYVTGRVRAPDFEHALRTSGMQFKPVMAYDTVLVSYTTEFLLEFFSKGEIDHCLLYSRWGAEEFLRLRGRGNIAHHFDNTSIFCLSPRVANALTEVDQALIHVANSPDEDALFELLQQAQDASCSSQ